MKEYLRILGHGATIVYVGRVAHPQNEALCNKFNLLGKMTFLRRADIVTEPGDSGLCQVVEKGLPPVNVEEEGLQNVILVDSNRADDGRVPFPMSPIAVVDHHRDSDIPETPATFLWLDDEVGSASTMVLELLAAAAPEDWEFRSDIALMLALGVYTDTKDMLSAGARDRDAFGWATRYCNSADLKTLIRYKRPDSYYRNLGHALQNYKHRHARLVATVGHIPVKQGDDLAMIADEFLRKNGVTLAVVWGVVEGEESKSVRVCARSEDLTLNLNQFLKERFGARSGAKTLPDGAGEGGALVQLDVGPWLREDEMVEAISRRINEWLFDEEEPDE
jgi:nanoRNase/pAp phosphatase (c-di-AMP/oligoRNAs hydrolase)